MRRCDTVRGREVEDRRKDEEMTAPRTLPSLDEPTPVELRRRDARKHQRRNVHTLPDALALAARPDLEPDRPNRAAQPGHGCACSQTILHGWIGCRAAAHSPRPRSTGHG